MAEVARNCRSADAALAYYLDASNNGQYGSALDRTTFAFKRMSQVGGSVKGVKELYPAYSMLTHTQRTQTDDNYNANAFVLELYSEQNFVDNAINYNLGVSSADAFLHASVTRKSVHRFGDSAVSLDFGGNYPLAVPQTGYYVLRSNDADDPLSGTPDVIEGTYDLGTADADGLVTLQVFSKTHYGSYLQNRLPMTFLQLDVDETTTTVLGTRLVVSAMPSYYSHYMHMASPIGAAVSSSSQIGAEIETHTLQTQMENEMKEIFPDVSGFVAAFGDHNKPTLTSFGDQKSTREKTAWPSLTLALFHLATQKYVTENYDRVDGIHAVAKKIFEDLKPHYEKIAGKFWNPDAEIKAKYTVGKIASNQSGFDILALLKIAAGDKIKHDDFIKGIAKTYVEMYERAFHGDADFLSRMPLISDILAAKSGYPLTLENDPKQVLDELLSLEPVDAVTELSKLDRGKTYAFLAKRFSSMLPTNAGGAVAKPSAVATLLLTLGIPDIEKLMTSAAAALLVDTAPDSYNFSSGSMLKTAANEALETGTHFAGSMLFLATPKTACVFMTRIAMATATSKEALIAKDPFTFAGLNQQYVQALLSATKMMHVYRHKEALRFLENPSAFLQQSPSKRTGVFLGYSQMFSIMIEGAARESALISYAFGITGKGKNTMLACDGETGISVAMVMPSAKNSDLMTNYTKQYTALSVLRKVGSVMKSHIRGSVPRAMFNLSRAAEDAKTASKYAEGVRANVIVTDDVAKKQLEELLSIVKSIKDTKLQRVLGGDATLLIAEDTTTPNISAQRLHITFADEGGSSTSEAVFDRKIGKFRIRAGPREDDTEFSDPVYMKRVMHTFPGDLSATELVLVLWLSDLYTTQADAQRLTKQQVITVNGKFQKKVNSALDHDPYGVGELANISASYEYAITAPDSDLNKFIAANPELVEESDAHGPLGRGMINTPEMAIGSYYGWYPYYGYRRHRGHRHHGYHRKYPYYYPYHSYPYGLPTPSLAAFFASMGV